MYWLVVMLLVMENINCAPSPLRLTIDCGSDEMDSSLEEPLFKSRADRNDGHFNVDSFCKMIQNAIPKTVRDGKFVPMDSDQEGYSDTQVPFSIAPPKGFIPKYPTRKPKLKVPKINVPKLKKSKNDSLNAPRIGNVMSIPILRAYDEESSAEKMERFKKGVQKMLHFVKVLGQIDQYVSERARIVVDKLSKTFAE